MLNLQELEVFLVAAEQGNFSEAGRRLHLSQPAVSQTIHNLEQRFGSQLFIRHGRTIRLSDAGETLLPMARELLGSANRLAETMASLRGTVIGKVVIGCCTASGRYLLPGIIGDFRRQFSQVRLEVPVMQPDEMFNKLLSGQIGIGISGNVLEHQELDYVRFYTDDVILIAPADHPWARCRRVCPEELLAMPFILHGKESETGGVMFSGLQACGISPDMLNVVMVLGYAETVEVFVEKGIGLSFVSRLAASRGLELGRIVEVAVEGLILKHDLYFVRNQRLPFTHSQSRFWDFMRSAAMMPT